MSKIKLGEIKALVKEVLDEMGLPEMARTAGTGGAITITPEGKALLQQVKASGAIPPGLAARHVQALVWLYKVSAEGKRVQKIDYAKEKGVPQPAVNPIFNDLITKGLVASEKYQTLNPGGQKAPGAAKPDIGSMLDDLDL